MRTCLAHEVSSGRFAWHVVCFGLQVLLNARMARSNRNRK